MSHTHIDHGQSSRPLWIQDTTAGTFGFRLLKESFCGLAIKSMLTMLTQSTPTQTKIQIHILIQTQIRYQTGRQGHIRFGVEKYVGSNN